MQPQPPASRSASSSMGAPSLPVSGTDPSRGGAGDGYPLFRERLTGAVGAAAEPARVQGRYADILLRPGLLLMVRDLVTLGDLHGRKDVGPAIQVGIMLEGAGTSRLGGHAGSVPFPAGKMSVMLIDQPASSEFFVPAGTTLRYLDIRFDRSFLDTILPDHPLLTEADLVDATMRACGVSFALMDLTPAMKRTAADILGRQGDEPCDKLFLEGRVIEVLSHAVEGLTARNALADGEGMRLRLSSRDRQRVREAHALLLSDLEQTPRLRDLARAVGLNENKLKVGFRQLYGNSVYAYFQEHRMMEAAALLRAGGQTVTDVALAVGYANPAHFSKVFRRCHGYPPSELLRREGVSAARRSQ